MTYSLIISERIALNCKVYSFNYYDNIDATETKNKKTLKGISKTTVKNEISHNDYINALETNEKQSRQVYSIRSFNHELFTYAQKKTALTSWTDKSYLIDSNNSNPYGYYKNTINN